MKCPPPRLVLVNGFGAPNTMLKHWPAWLLSCDDLKSDANVSWHFANQMEDHANINFCFFIVDLYPCSSENATCLWIDRQPWLLWRLCVNIDVMFCSLPVTVKLVFENDWIAADVFSWCWWQKTTELRSISVLLVVWWCLSSWFWTYG